MYLQNDSSSGGTSRRRRPGAELGSPGRCARVPSTATLRRGPPARRDGEAGGPAPARCPPSALRGSRRCPRPQPPAPASHSLRPAPSQPAPPRPSRPATLPYLAAAPLPRGSRSGPRRRRAWRAGEGWRRSARLLLRGGGAPISPPAPGSAPRWLHSSPVRYHRPPSPLASAASPRASAPLGPARASAPLLP